MTSPRVQAAAPAPLRTADGVDALSLFALDPSTVHLNHGSYGAVPRSAVAAQHRLLDEMNAIPGAWFSSLSGRVADAREHIAAFLRVDPELTALVPNASAGVSIVLNSLQLAPGARIVITDHAYGAVQMACERAVRRVGGQVVVAPVDLDADDAAAAEAILAACDERTALVVVDQISSATARVFPLEELGRRTRAAGIPLLIDAAHAPAQIEAPLAGIDADYWIGNLHKWACTPRGTAALVVTPAVAPTLHPLIDSWAAPDGFPRSFDMQGTIDLTAWLAAPQAIDDIDAAFGWDRVREYIDELVGHGRDLIAGALAEQLDGEDAATDRTPPAPHPGALAPALRLVPLPASLIAGPEDTHPLFQVLAANGFQTAVTRWRDSGFLRLSAHLYNTAADYELFAERAVPLLGRLADIRRAEPGIPLAAAALRLSR